MITWADAWSAVDQTNPSAATAVLMTRATDIIDPPVSKEADSDSRSVQERLQST
jgi:hypothetical protein